jgi:GNAT superfamily N-acetyltransferase
MHTCSLHRKLHIVEGDMKDYESLAAYHYRDARPVAVKAVFAIKSKTAGGLRSYTNGKPAGVIVYTMPNPRVELRDVATDGLFGDLDRQSELALINRNIRCIARLVIDPRFRGIGLASRLVRQTLPRMNVPIIEAIGVMPSVNPFLEKAGMKPFVPPVPRHHVELIEAFSVMGIESDELIWPSLVQAKMDALSWPACDFLEIRIQQFLKSHGRRRTMLPGLERTRYILGKLTHRPVYYIWFNPEKEVTLP